MFNLFKKSHPEVVIKHFDYYPETYNQDTKKSILTSDGYYDLTRFSSHEDSIIRQVISNANKKYPAKYRALGLANESNIIVYKPRYVLFELLITAFNGSESALDQIAVSFAYIQKGAVFRKNATHYFEKSISKIPLKTLDKFSSVSILSMLSQIAKTYESEHEYKKAIYWTDVLIREKTGNTDHFIKKKEELIKKEENFKPLRRKKIQDRQAEFERQTRIAALKYLKLLKI